MRMWISATTAATLILGFGIASLTGNRALGGVVLLVGGALGARWTYQFSGLGRTIAVVTIVIVLFGLSHPLGHLIGGWPSVITVAALGAATTYLLAPPKTPSAASSTNVESRT